jgi:hypothetical protein
MFFDTLAARLLADYRLCTADSSEKSVPFLLEWRESVDSTLTQTDMKTITKKFTVETGIPATRARPCELVKWLQESGQREREHAELLAARRDSLIQEHNDSVLVAKEVAAEKREGYDINGAPFGISRHALLLLLRHSGTEYSLTPAGTLVIDSTSSGTPNFRIALHFNKEERYEWYELESASCGPDSLDIMARPLMECIASGIEARTSRPPDHIYRVGRFDIVPGRLAICKLWEFPDAFVYIGLARSGNRFYAKAIARQK